MMPKSCGKMIDVQRIPLRNVNIKITTGVFINVAFILRFYMGCSNLFLMN